MTIFQKVFILLLSSSLVYSEQNPIVAICEWESVSIKFTETKNGVEMDTTHAGLTGLNHGLYVYKSGDLLGDFSEEDVYNPYNKDKGCDPTKIHRLGDLGDIESGKIIYSLPGLSLQQSQTILGRTLAISDKDCASTTTYPSPKCVIGVKENLNFQYNPNINQNYLGICQFNKLKNTLYFKPTATGDQLEVVSTNTPADLVYYLNIVDGTFVEQIPDITNFFKH